MGHVRCRFSSRQHTPLQQRSHHAGSPCRRQSSLATATLRLPRQFVGRYNLLLYRLPYHTRARTATLPHPSPAYATSPSSGTALGGPSWGFSVGFPFLATPSLSPWASCAAIPSSPMSPCSLAARFATPSYSSRLSA